MTETWQRCDTWTLPSLFPIDLPVFDTDVALLVHIWIWSRVLMFGVRTKHNDNTELMNTISNSRPRVNSSPISGPPLRLTFCSGTLSYLKAKV